MKLILMLLFSILYLTLLTGCESITAKPQIHIDTKPIGLGLAAIAGACVLAAFIQGDDS
jgi:hypothetical protein